MYVSTWPTFWWDRSTKVVQVAMEISDDDRGADVTGGGQTKLVLGCEKISRAIRWFSFLAGID